ncbi:hypothetical protein RE943_26900 [Prescottella equi]|nr:hypothetical protein RE943_26900 [Prescottella equi]
MQAVVVHDVEAIGTVFREFQHEPEVGVMVREELRMRHRRITAGEATRPERPDPQVSARDVGIGTVRGEQGYLVADALQRSRQVPHVRFEAPGERLTDGVARRRDDCNP